MLLQLMGRIPLRSANIVEPAKVSAAMAAVVALPRYRRVAQVQTMWQLPPGSQGPHTPLHFVDIAE